MGKTAAECAAELGSRLSDVQNTLSGLLGIFAKADTVATCRYDRSHMMPPGAIPAHEQKCRLKKADLDPKEGYPTSYAAYADGCPNVVTLFLEEDTIKQIAADVESNQRSGPDLQHEHRPFDISDVEVVDEGKKVASLCTTLIGLWSPDQEMALVEPEEGKADLWRAIDEPELKLWWIHEWKAIPRAQTRLPEDISLLPHNQVRGWLFGNIPPLLLPRPGADVDLVNHISSRLHTYPSIDAELLLRELLPHLGSAAKGFVLAVWKFVCRSVVEASSGVLFRDIEDRPYNRSMLQRLTGNSEARSNDVESRPPQPVAIRQARPKPSPEMFSGIPHTIDDFTRSHPVPIRLAVYDHVIRATAPQRTLRQPVLSELQADAAVMTEGVKQDQACTVEQKMAGLRESKRRSRSYRGARAAAKKPYTEVLRVVIYNRMGDWSASTDFGPDARVVRARGWNEVVGKFESKTKEKKRGRESRIEDESERTRERDRERDRERRGEREVPRARSREKERRDETRREGRDRERRKGGRRDSNRDELQDGHWREKEGLKEEQEMGKDVSNVENDVDRMTGNLGTVRMENLAEVGIRKDTQRERGTDARSRHRSSSHSRTKDKNRHKKRKSHKETLRKESDASRKRKHSSSSSDEGEERSERGKSAKMDCPGEEEGEIGHQ